mmetsp:Transcript_14618/g.27439  ORF Transcript_14618/g.27439 Transcript_14618/m.27439 type:complete len:105 (+) Transcript_14618:393-707(+)
MSARFALVMAVLVGPSVRGAMAITVATMATMGATVASAMTVAASVSMVLGAVLVMAMSAMSMSIAVALVASMPTVCELRGNLRFLFEVLLGKIDDIMRPDVAQL